MGADDKSFFPTVRSLTSVSRPSSTLSNFVPVRLLAFQPERRKRFQRRSSLIRPVLLRTHRSERLEISPEGLEDGGTYSLGDSGGSGGGEGSGGGILGGSDGGVDVGGVLASGGRVMAGGGEGTEGGLGSGSGGRGAVGDFGGSVQGLGDLGADRNGTDAVGGVLPLCASKSFVNYRVMFRRGIGQHRRKKRLYPSCTSDSEGHLCPGGQRGYLCLSKDLHFVSHTAFLTEPQMLFGNPLETSVPRDQPETNQKTCPAAPTCPKGQIARYQEHRGSPPIIPAGRIHVFRMILT